MTGGSAVMTGGSTVMTGYDRKEYRYELLEMTGGSMQQVYQCSVPRL